MRCLKFENQGNPVNQRKSHRGRKRIFGKSTEVAHGRTSVNFREKNSINLRGHQFTLEHKRLYTPSRVNYFANRVVNNWNSLPDYIVGAGTLNMYKNSLDRLWSKQDLLYNYRATIEKSNYVY